MSKHGSKITRTGNRRKHAAVVDTGPGLFRRLALRIWTSLQAFVVLGFLGFLLFAIAPVWYAQVTERLKVLVSEVAIEPGSEQEWKLLPASGSGQPVGRKTELLLPSSQFNHRTRQLVLIAASFKGGFIKLVGQCRPSPVSGPWDLDCSGDWANVRQPQDALLAAVSVQKPELREHGRFTVAFFKGGREGNVTLTPAEQHGTQSAAVQRFFLVRGK